MHSFSFDHESIEPGSEAEDRITRFYAEYAAALPGQTVTMHPDLQPLYVNVEMSELDEHETAAWPESATLVPGRVVVPVLATVSNKAFKYHDKEGNQVIRIRSTNHEVDLGFAVTVYKVQVLSSIL